MRRFFFCCCLPSCSSPSASSRRRPSWSGGTDPQADREPGLWISGSWGSCYRWRSAPEPRRENPSGSHLENMDESSFNNTVLNKADIVRRNSLATHSRSDIQYLKQRRLIAGDWYRNLSRPKRMTYQDEGHQLPSKHELIFFIHHTWIYIYR